MRWRSRADCESGTVTAEFAVAVPAVVLVLAACLGGLRLGAERIRLTDAAAQQARQVARGEPGVAGAPAGTVRRDGGVVCVDVRDDVPVLGLPVPISASACALSGAVP